MSNNQLSRTTIFENQLYFIADFDATENDLWTYHDGFTGVEDHDISDEFYVFPNPSSGDFKIIVG